MRVRVLAATLLLALVSGSLAVHHISHEQSRIADQAWVQPFVDHTGESRSLSELLGQYAVVTFGFTQCPDICPITLQGLSRAMSLLERRQADPIKVIFITVDPERDTIDILNKYIPYYNPNMIGLRGTDEATRLVVRRFHAFYRKVPGRRPGQYSMDHSASAFVLDPQGQWVDELPHSLSVEDIVARIEMLQAEAPSAQTLATR